MLYIKGSHEEHSIYPYVLGALLAGTVQMYAVKAYPWPVQVTQPDGSVITIQKHGDEFLHWTTSGGRLVTQGKDGFITGRLFPRKAGKSRHRYVYSREQCL